MSMNRQYITDCDMQMYQEEANNNPGFEASGSITVRLQHRFQIRQTTMNRDTVIDQDDYTTRTMVTLSKELRLLCIPGFTKYWVNRMFQILQVNNPDEEESIHRCETAIVRTVVDWAEKTTTFDRGLKRFGLRADLQLTTTTEIVRSKEQLDLIMMELREKDLRRELLQTMEEKNLKRNPALKRSLFEEESGDGGVVIKKNCVVCLDDFEIGSEVISMPCSHMFHEECLFPWLKENKSCPLCRLELTP